MNTFAIPSENIATIVSADNIFEALEKLEVSGFYGRYYELQNDGSWEQCYHF